MRATIRLLSLILVCGCAHAAGPKPAAQRVMSLNLCADQLLMELLPESRIASITWLSRSEGDPALMVMARRLPVNHGSAEEVLRAHPDLVIAGQFTTGNTRALLKRAGIPVMEIEPVSDWEGIRRVTRALADRIGARDQAERLLAQMDRDLADTATLRPAVPVRVIGWGGAGEDVPGRDTLFNTILTAAGGENIAAQAASPVSFDVEQVLRLQPAVLMRGAAYAGKPALRNAAATHPALRARYAGHMLTYPEAVYGCGVPRAARLARDLARQFAKLRVEPR